MSTTHTRMLIAITVVVSALALLVACRAPAFGWVTFFVALTVMGLVNALLDIRSARIGLLLGTFLALLASATALGSGAPPLLALAGAAVGFVFGYGFGRFEVELAAGGDADAPKATFKSGKGGNFDGGGSSGRF